MAAIVSDIGNKLIDKGEEYTKDMINWTLLKKHQHDLGIKIIDPFDIYEFTIKIYWLLCFKLKFDNTYQTELEYYSDIVAKNLLQDLYNPRINNSKDEELVDSDNTKLIESNNIDSMILPNSVLKFIESLNESTEFTEELKKNLKGNPLFIKKIVLYAYNKDNTIFNRNNSKKYMNTDDIEYEAYVSSSIPKHWKYTEWYSFVENWNNSNCDMNQYNTNKSQGDRESQLINTYGMISDNWKGTTSGLSYPITEPSDTTDQGKYLKLTRIPLVFQKNCNIKNSSVQCNEKNISENFMNYNLIKDDLVRILYIVISRILYGDFDNCYFDWYNDKSNARLYREDLQKVPLKEGIDNSEFTIDNLKSFNRYLNYLININTPGLLGIIKLHTRSLKKYNHDNDYEFIKENDDNNKIFTMKGTLSTYQIFNSNIFTKFKNEKIQSSTICVSSKLKQKSDTDGISNLYLASLAWKTLYNLKRTLIFLYEYSLILSSSDLTSKINQADLKKQQKSIKHNILKDSEFIFNDIDRHNDSIDMFQSIYIPAINSNKITECIKNIQSDLWLGRYKNNEAINPNKNLLQTEYLSVVYNAVCRDITEDDARLHLDELTNNSQSDQLNQLLDNKSDEINHIVDNLIYKGGITTKNLNKEVITNNIKNVFHNFQKKTTTALASFLKRFDGRDKIIEEYKSETLVLLNGHNLENLYNVIEWTTNSLLSENYLLFFSLINSVSNYNFTDKSTIKYSKPIEFINKYSIMNNYSIHSIQPKNYSNMNTYLSKYIIIGFIYNNNKNLDQNKYIGQFDKQFKIILLNTEAINNIEDQLHNPGNINDTISDIFKINTNDNKQNENILNSYYILDTNYTEESHFIQFMMNILYYYNYQRIFISESNKCNIIGMILNHLFKSNQYFYYKLIISYSDTEYTNTGISIPAYKLNCGPISYKKNADFDEDNNKKIYNGELIKPLHYYYIDENNNINQYPIKYTEIPGNSNKNIYGIKDINGYLLFHRINCSKQIIKNNTTEYEKIDNLFTYKPNIVLPYYCLFINKVYSNTQYKISIKKLLQVINDNISDLLKSNNPTNKVGGKKKTKKINK